MAQRPRRDPLPRALRRQSDRPAVARRQPPDALIAQARRGVLTRRNTLPHTKGRQAVDAVAYQSRARRTSPEETVRARLGHAPAPTVTWSEDAEHVHVRQSDQQLHHAFGVTLQSGSPSLSRKALTLAGRDRQTADPVPPSDPKRHFGTS